MTKKQDYSNIFLIFALALLCISIFGSYLFKSIMTYFEVDFQSFLRELLNKHFFESCLAENAGHMNHKELYQYCNRENKTYYYLSFNTSFISLFTQIVRYNLTSVAFFNNIVDTGKNILLFLSGICLVIYQTIKRKKESTILILLLSMFIFISIFKILLLSTSLLAIVSSAIAYMCKFYDTAIFEYIYNANQLLVSFANFSHLLIGIIITCILVGKSDIYKWLKVTILMIVFLLIVPLIVITFLATIDNLINYLVSVDSLYIGSQYVLNFGAFKFLWKFISSNIPKEMLFGRIDIRIQNGEYWQNYLVNLIYILPDLSRLIYCLLCIFGIIYTSINVYRKNEKIRKLFLISCIIILLGLFAIILLISIFSLIRLIIAINI